MITYALNELLNKKEDYTYLLDKYDFYFVPLMNPDGIVYTWLSEDEGGDRRSGERTGETMRKRRLGKTVMAWI